MPFRFWLEKKRNFDIVLLSHSCVQIGMIHSDFSKRLQQEILGIAFEESFACVSAFCL